MIESRYLKFEKIGDTGKTEIWNILSKSSQSTILGKISWFSRWRQYCFLPSSDCVFNAECMTDITKMTNKLMEDRAKAARIKKRMKDRSKK